MNEKEKTISPDGVEQYEEAMKKMEDITSDYVYIAEEDTDDFVNAVTTNATTAINETFQPRNRAERRALEKATRRQKQKKKKMYVDSIKEATTKLAYIDMIQKVRELNEKIKEEGEKENEATN